MESRVINSHNNIQRDNWCNRINHFIFDIEEEERKRVINFHKGRKSNLTIEEIDGMIANDWKMGNKLGNRLDAFLKKVNMNLVDLYGKNIINLAGITHTIGWNKRELGYPRETGFKQVTDTKLGWTRENCEKLEKYFRTNRQLLTWTQEVDRPTASRTRSDIISLYDPYYTPASTRTRPSGNITGYNPKGNTEGIDYAAKR